MYTTINSSVESKLNQLQGKAGQFVSAEWVSVTTPAAAYKGNLLEKVTKSVVRTGIDFSNLSTIKEGIENGTRGEVGKLPWGEWKQFPYHITHKGADYIRVYPVKGTKPKVDYKVNGQVVDRDTFKKYLTPSAQASLEGEVPECFTVKAENVSFK